MAEVAGDFVQTWQEQGLGSALSGVLLPTLKDIAAAIFDAEGAAGSAGGRPAADRRREGHPRNLERDRPDRCAASGSGWGGCGDGRSGWACWLRWPGSTPSWRALGAAALAGILTVQVLGRDHRCRRRLRRGPGRCSAGHRGCCPTVVDGLGPRRSRPVCGGRQGSAARSARSARHRRAEEAAATALRAAATSLIDLRLFNQGQITATAAARQQEARQAEEGR